MDLFGITVPPDDGFDKSVVIMAIITIEEHLAASPSEDYGNQIN